MLFSSLLSTTLALSTSIWAVSAHDAVQARSSLESRQYSDSDLATVITTCTESGTFAMSFDDGPYMYGSSIAKYFEQHGSLASFFVNGENYDCIYDYADDLIERYQAGHLIGSHTWGHDDVTTLNADEFNQQLDLVETALAKILGVKPRFFRPPYGTYNNQALKILKERGYTVVTWDFDSGDSTGSTPDQSVEAYSTIYGDYPKPHMALNHETYAGTAQEIVPKVVPKLLLAGYKLVPISDCLGVDPYQSVFKAGTRDDTWTCDGTPGPGDN
ncbi:hypothetical protein P7C70_g3085, partial [Phenoliferia sp. Uapishka_3]